MYEGHPSFDPPPNDAVLWRYMDFTKFVSLLNKESLFFARTDQLGDPFEGSTTTADYSRRLEWIARQSPPDLFAGNALSVSKGKRQARAWTLVNCWHENKYESEAMWKLYARNHGLAIKTTFRRLSQSFTCTESIYIGRVDYIDYDTANTIDTRGDIIVNNMFDSFLRKRKSFEHEHEVRAMASCFPPKCTATGEYFRVDIHSLIDEVVVDPHAQDWFEELIRSVAIRYGLQTPVAKSSLAASPVW